MFDKSQKLSARIVAPIVLAAFALIVVAERFRPLRRQTHSTTERDTRNLIVAALAGAAIAVAETPLTEPLARFVERRNFGLVKLFKLPAALEIAAAFVLLDYTFYLWHVLTHKVGFLWRLHLVHHTDLDMDATTALRFHFVGMIVSAPYRALQILTIGASPLAFSIWQTFVFVSILFHHSNLRLPIEIERKLIYLVVTPRHHGIHHSIVPEETDSNWSSGLTVWDYLHGTLRLDVPQNQIEIGVPAYRNPRELELKNTLALPFVNQPDSWRLPSGARPGRAKRSINRLQP